MTKIYASRMTISEFGKIFEPRLQLWVKEKIVSYQQYTHDESVLQWIQYTEQLIAAGGKRIRPYLVALIYDSLKNECSKAMWQVCIALELFHLFALIHDDIIDKGESRRGVLTANVYIAKQLRTEKRICDADHIGVSQAILLGDLLLAWSLELMSHADIPPAVKQSFHIMIDEVVIGQMLDVDIMTRTRVDEKIIAEKMYLKTASYTFIQPLLLGAGLATAASEVTSFCKDFGCNLGLAFQIQDDLLDIRTPADISGKNPFSDLRDRQHTYFTQFILDTGSESDKEKLCALWGKELSEHDRPAVMNLFEESGALAYGKNLITSFFEKAEKAIATSPLPTSKKNDFQQLTTYIRNRAA